MIFFSIQFLKIIQQPYLFSEDIVQEESKE